jgi:hypothetical protein
MKSSKKKTAKSKVMVAAAGVEAKPRLPRAPAGIITVTREIAQSAEQKNSSHCGIAEAIALTYPWAKGIAVDIQTIRFSNPKKRLRYVYLTPRTGQKYIVAFDQGEKTNELSFRLRGGHVMPMAGYTEKGKKNKKAYYEKMKSTPVYKSSHQRAKQRRTFLRARGLGRLPDRFGGTAPPVAPGRRREFGLRALTR